MRVLVVSQYPIYPALHGGQKRVSAIFSYYQERNVAKHLAICWPDIYDIRACEDSESIVISNQALRSELSGHPELSDILLSKALSDDERVANGVRKTIRAFKPDIVHVEQPYLVAPIKAVLVEVGSIALVIHGSQNVEFILKQDIYKNHLPSRDYNYLVKTTRSIETSAIIQADINICVSQADAKIFRKNDRLPSSRWHVVANGTDCYAKFSQEKDNLGPIFIGSAHPPNYTGIESLLMDTSYINDTHALHLIGGVADYFRDKYKNSNAFWVGKKSVGKVTQEALNEYVNSADVIVLPIINGGGSNLKTAEAICAHKKIVGTDFSFRGFERFKSFPNVYIANSPKEFKAQLLKAMRSDFQEYTPRQEKAIRKLSWRYTLRPLRMIIAYAQMRTLLRYWS